MKKLALAAALAATTSAALAGGGAMISQQSSTSYYAGMNGGISIVRGVWNEPVQMFNNTRPIRNGFNVGGFAGVRFNDNYHFDGSFDFIRNTYSSEAKNLTSVATHTDSYLFMFSAYYDMPQLSMANLTPYVGTGIGLMRTNAANLDITSISNQPVPVPVVYHRNHLAIQFATGLNYELNNNIAIGVGYRFINTFTRYFNTYYNLANASLTYKFSM